MRKDFLLSEIQPMLPDMELRANDLSGLQMALPATHFSEATLQCKHMYIMGYFYGAIMVAQGCAEGLAKHIAKVKQLDEKYYYDGLPPKGCSVNDRIGKLLELGKINKSDADKFNRIHKAYRNELHHMNRVAPKSNDDLKNDALSCVKDLWGISVIGLSINKESRIVIHDSDLWDVNNGDVTLYVACSYL